MEGPSRSGGFRQSRRSRSQRDRERRRRRVDLAEERATSLSSGSEREVCATGSVLGPGGRECRPGLVGPRHRPPRRRKRESVSCEEDIIDGFSIASFISFEALEMDCSMKPTQRAAMLMIRGNKRKRVPGQNGEGALAEPGEGVPPSFSHSCRNRNRKKRRKTEGGGILFLETGYICDTESESADKASDRDLDPVFTVSTRKVLEPVPVSMASSVGKGGPPLPLQGRCGLSRLAVTPRVSGLERSQERSLEPPYPELQSTSSPFPCPPALSPAAVAVRPGHLNGSSNGIHHHRPHHNPSPPRSKHKTFLTFPSRQPALYRNGTSAKPPSSSAASSSLSVRPPTPSSSMSLVRGPGSSGSLRPPSRANSGSMFTSSPGLPPLPPLVTSQSGADQDLLRQGLNSHFLASQEREGRPGVPGAEANGGRPGPSTPGGPSGAGSSSGSSGRSSQAQPSIPPLAFQFHQHNHQHQHTHTHQHFTPFLHPTASAPPQHLFEKYGSKMDGLYRNTFFPQYPPPSVPGIQPVLPPTGPFSSLQGAFQPKPLAPQGSSSEMTARLGVVPHHLQPKDPRLTDPFGTSLKVSNKPGKWCAMHVHVAWMILSHQKKVKLMQADPHKLDFRNDLLARLPGAGGLGPLGPLRGGLRSPHDLNRPASLFTATGAVNPSSSPFIPPSTPHSSFLTPTAHMDPYVRSPPFTPLGALGSGAFGGLGSPTLANGSLFGHKEPPAVGGLPNPHDPWNRLHGGPSPFAGPSWARGAEKRDERDPGKDMERDVIHIKDEKDRDNMQYGRQPVRMSPVAPALKLQQRSNTPVSHHNGHAGPPGGPVGLTEDLTRGHSRDRERDGGDNRPLSSRPPPLGPLSATTDRDRDRPRSSSSSALATPPPSGPAAPSLMDLYPRQQGAALHSLHGELPYSSQREGGPLALSSSATVTSLSQGKKPDRTTTTTPVPKPPPLFPPVKVKEERKEEPDPVPISLPPPPHALPGHSFERPNSRPHHHRSSTPSSSLSLTPTPGVPLPPPVQHNSQHHLALLERSRAQATLEAYLGSAQGAGGIVVGPGGERFSAHPHGPPQGHGQHPHSFPWDPWRELAAQQQQQQQRREAMALRSDPHLARLLQHQHAQRFMEAERAAAVAASNPHHHPPTSTPSVSSARQEFGLLAHHFDRPPQLGPPGGGLMDEQQRAQILREDFERARYFGMHAHPHLSGSHLPPGSHAAHLEQLHAGMLSQSHLHQPGGAAAGPHHPGIYSRLGPLHAHHVPNGILTKTPTGLVGALSVGAPPPLIPSVTSRSSTPTRRLGDMALYGSHKDVRFYPDDDSFNKNLVKENWSEISEYADRTLISILEVESTKDLCPTEQTGAACSQSGTGGGPCEEEGAVQQRTPPDAGVLSGDPLEAAQDAEGSSQHALQTAAAERCRRVCETNVRQENRPVVDSEDPSLVTECHKHSDTQTDKALQYSHFGPQASNSGHPGSQAGGTEGIDVEAGWDQALQQGDTGGLVVVSGTESAQVLPENEILEYKQETGMEEHAGGRSSGDLPSESCSTASPLPLGANKDAVQHHTEGTGMEQQETAPANQASGIPLSEVNKQAGRSPNSEKLVPPALTTGHSERTQTDVSTGPKITMQDSNDCRRAVHGADEQGPQEPEGSLEKSESGCTTLGSWHTQTPLPAPSTEVSWTPQLGQTHPALVPYTPPGSGNSTPNYLNERQEGESDLQNSPPRPAVEQAETNSAEADTEMADLSADLTIRPKGYFRPETSTTALITTTATAAAPSICHLHGAELDLMQTEQSVQVPTANSDTLHASELLVPASAHSAVMLAGESALEFSEEVQVNQCVFLEEHVSGDPAVLELHADLSAAEPKSFIDGTHSDIGMASLAGGEYEIYSFVEEEIATEVVEDRLPLSPSYEVNLFTPVIEHSENCTASEGQDVHLLSSRVTSNDNSQVLVQQGLLTSDDGLSEMEVCSNDFTPTISSQDVTTDEGQILRPENTATKEAVAVEDDSTNVCLIQTVLLSDTPNVRTDNLTEAPETGKAVPDHRRVSISSAATSFCDTRMLPGQTGTGATASTSSLVVPLEGLIEELVETTSQHSVEVLSSPITATPNCPLLDRGPGVSSEKATVPDPGFLPRPISDPLALPAALETQMEIRQDIDCAGNVTKPEAPQYTLSPGVIDPQLLLLKPVATPLKHPPSILFGLTRPQGDRLSQAGAMLTVECLPKAVTGPVPECVSVIGREELSESLMDVEPPGASSPTSTPFRHRLDRLTTPNECKSDNEALSLNRASLGKAGAVSRTLNPPDVTNAASKRLSGFALPSTSGAVSRGNLFGFSSDGGQSGPPPVSRPRLAGVKGLGFCSPKDESSDGEDDLQDEEPAEEEEEEEEKEEKASLGGMCSPSGAESKHELRHSRPDRETLFSKVRQWIADRVTPSSSPVSPSPSTPSPCPGPSSSSDWTPSTTPLLLRGAHGRFLSPPSTGPGGSSSSDSVTIHRPRMERRADMAELAKHEAEIEGRTLALKKEGFWSIKRLTRLTEPVRTKVQWDYLCEEMQWLSADFAQERRWKRGVARKVVRMVMRYHEEIRQKEEKAKRDEHAKIRRVASNIAKEVRAFWSSVEKVVQYKQQSRLEEKRKKALDLQLDFIVGQTEKYSDLLSQALETAPAGISEPAPSPPKKALPPAVDEDDRDFEPPCEEEDDEETIDMEEAQEGNDTETQRKEIELLRQEGTMSLTELLSTLKIPPSQDSDEEGGSDNSSAAVDEDEEFTANEEDAEDEEDTIAAQEVVEGEVDHADELDDLAKEGDMSMEELLEKYKGAYASDFEEPSTSATPASSDESEKSGEEDEEEEESEEAESDIESNTNTSSSDNEESDEEVASENEEDSDEDECDEGMEILLKEGDHSPALPSGQRPKKEISHIAATAESLQPKGYTLATTKVKTPIPFLLVGQLREYQHIGLDWLVTMYEKKLNGILADEMGLGKTIQTIALLAHLACEKGNWGPHLIIVPTSVMLNWEMELKRWCPGFKILTYYGSQKERKLKRQGWTKPNAFHVCITSYKLVLQDHQAFRRKSWRYLILDEAQNIKNFKSQRWQSLLNFNSQRRLLLTGTPLQNSLMELWSLMHFLMPHVFQSHREFKEWFSNPLTGMIEGSQEYNEGLVKRLHKVLRPFLLRRIKVDVEKQMPKKYEHVVRCRLSKRQRFLYDDFMAQASTRETLASGHFMSVINILMQLRKVCNHPNLFDPRPIHSPFITKPIVFHTASLVQRALEISPFKRCDLSLFDLVGLEGRVSRYQADVFLPRHRVTHQLIQEVMESPESPPRPKPVRMKVNRMFQPLPKTDSRTMLVVNNPRPACNTTPAPQVPRPPSIQDVTPTSTPSPPVQQVMCSVAPTPPSRPPTHPASAVGTAARAGSPMPVMTVRPPSASCPPKHSTPPPSNLMTQRVLLSPDMQARLPSGEVVSIAQLASLAGRPVSSSQGSKPVTFQLQGNKLTLSGTQLHHVPVAPPRAVQGNVMHLVTSGGQHHLISQPAQVAVFSSANTHTSPAPSGIQLPVTATQVPSSMVTGSGIVKIVVRQSGKEGGVPTLAVPPSPRVVSKASASTLQQHANQGPLQGAHYLPGPATAQYTLAPPRTPTSVTIRTSTPAPPRTSTPAPPRIPTPAPSRTPAPPRIPTLAPPRTSTPAPPCIPTSAPSQPPNPHPVQKAEKEPAETSVERKACVSSSSLTREDNSDTKSAVPKSGSHVGGFVPPGSRTHPRAPPRSPFFMSWLAESRKEQRYSRLAQIAQINDLHCSASPVFGYEVLDFLTFLPGLSPAPARQALGQWGRSGHAACLFAQSQSTGDYWDQSHALRDAIHTRNDRLQLLQDVIERFTFVIPPVEAPPITLHSCHPPPSLSNQQVVFTKGLSSVVAPLTHSLHRIQCNMRTHFPDLRLIQYDCGKLQTLHTLLRRLKEGQHRVLIFTQMTRMLDVLEQFLNYHGHIYLRLDGSTRIEQRQSLMDRFNADRRIFCFILSTRSGGVGVNLTGADTVVFYDSDWNPTMDAQAQDRCHRIGQTRDVHIYRLISERTVEENILKKANQKRMLGDMAIEGGNFTIAFFKQQTIRELFDETEGEKEAIAELADRQPDEEEAVNKQSTTILEQALCRAEDEEDIVAASQAKAEQVAELAEFNEAIPLDETGDGRDPEEEELSKAEQEIAALVEQLTPIERYAMNFLEASLEDVCKEELKQAEEQVEAARKGLDQAKEEGLKLQAGSTDDEDEDDFSSHPAEEHSATGKGAPEEEAERQRNGGRLVGGDGVCGVGPRSYCPYP
ncbi:hypothetical protein DPEC_G00327730 [Dallia pectoralis]|uniref:Uncharacterized protein n=1 Tax=Dallia pectoralis TaxID=75939 RepID=A0ACC2F864_DALPE|nr:hypothetical protein DPEC_G00327730 [Dallia pectoralis]